ncbi:hypothetical protein [Paenibacillus polymyxa]
MDKNVEIATEHYETSNQPYGSLVTLIADKPVDRLYAQFGV